MLAGGDDLTHCGFSKADIKLIELAVHRQQAVHGQLSAAAPSTEPSDGGLDAYPTHNWGDGNINPFRVSEINHMLQSAGLATWFESEKMGGQIMDAMAKGIAKSKVVVAFVTRLYLEAQGGWQGD
jgi:hypothetical protein